MDKSVSKLTDRCMHVYTFNVVAILFLGHTTYIRKYYILHDSVPPFVIDGYNHCLKAAGGTDSPGGFDSIRARNFLTLDASTLTANTDEDILYKIICDIVSKILILDQTRVYQ